jgi:hypothetical protein
MSLITHKVLFKGINILYQIFTKKFFYEYYIFLVFNINNIGTALYLNNKALVKFNKNA